MAPTPDRFPLSSGICASNLGLRMGFINKCEGFGREGWALLALGGTILTLVSAIFALASPKTRIAWALLLTGGILAVAGCRYGRSLILRLEAHWVSQRAMEPGGFLPDLGRRCTGPHYRSPRLVVWRKQEEHAELNRILRVFCTPTLSSHFIHECVSCLLLWVGVVWLPLVRWKVDREYNRDDLRVFVQWRLGPDQDRMVSLSRILGKLLLDGALLDHLFAGPYDV